MDLFTKACALAFALIVLTLLTLLAVLFRRVTGWGAEFLVGWVMHMVFISLWPTGASQSPGRTH